MGVGQATRSTNTRSNGTQETQVQIPALLLTPCVALAKSSASLSMPQFPHLDNSPASKGASKIKALKSVMCGGGGGGSA